MDLFTNSYENLTPLAVRMRPNTLKDFVGQEHILYKDSFLYRAIITSSLGSCIFFGPPGTGKTTIANIISKTGGGIFKKLNAVSSGVSEAKEIISEAKNNFKMYGKKTYLLLDECHRWSKAQSDSVLQAVEEGYIVFIGSTTENPYINMTKAIISRCQVFEFKPLSEKDIVKCLVNAITNKEKGLGNFNIKYNNEALSYIAFQSGGDLRNAYNILEIATKTTYPNSNGEIVLTINVIKDCVNNKSIGLDENSFYDVLSAFCKSLRGSDADAALLYSQKLLQNGCDPKIIARRLIAHASEDIGMADSNALIIANAAMNSVINLGMPECNLNLCHAIIYLCEAEKSNSVYIAMQKASEDATNNNIVIPNNLKNHPTGYDDKTGDYKYPHNFGGYCKQTYLPKGFENKIYYEPKQNGNEKGVQTKKSKYNK